MKWRPIIEPKDFIESLEQNDEWAVQRACYMTVETIALLSERSLTWHSPASAPPGVKHYANFRRERPGEINHL
jgi:hypothetical protein